MLYFLSLIVGLLLFTLSVIFSSKLNNANKITSFECGFRAVGSIHSPFSMHFFIILVIFIIFDLELVLLLGCIIRSVFGLFTFTSLIVFVVGGLYLEWYLGKLV